MVKKKIKTEDKRKLGFLLGLQGVRKVSSMSRQESRIESKVIARDSNLNNDASMLLQDL